MSLAVGQTTTVAGLTWHSPLALLQNREPLQALPSSLLAQSLSCLHRQVLVPLTQAPLLQLSPVVQALPSSQAVRSGLGLGSHWPLAGLQAGGFWQGPPLPGHEMTLTGLTLHTYGKLDLSQKSLPLQGLPSSLQSALTLQAHTFSPVHLPSW